MTPQTSAPGCPTAGWCSRRGRRPDRAASTSSQGHRDRPELRAGVGRALAVGLVGFRRLEIFCEIAEVGRFWSGCHACGRSDSSDLPADMPSPSQIPFSWMCSPCCPGSAPSMVTSTETKQCSLVGTDDAAAAALEGPDLGAGPLRDGLAARLARTTVVVVAAAGSERKEESSGETKAARFRDRSMVSRRLSCVSCISCVSERGNSRARTSKPQWPHVAAPPWAQRVCGRPSSGVADGRPRGLPTAVLGVTQAARRPARTGDEGLAKVGPACSPSWVL